MKDTLEVGDVIFISNMGNITDRTTIIRVTKTLALTTDYVFRRELGLDGQPRKLLTTLQSDNVHYLLGTDELKEKYDLFQTLLKALSECTKQNFNKLDIKQLKQILEIIEGAE